MTLLQTICCDFTLLPYETPPSKTGENRKKAADKSLTWVKRAHCSIKGS